MDSDSTSMLPTGATGTDLQIKPKAREFNQDEWRYIYKAVKFAIEAAESQQGDPIRGRIWAGRYRDLLPNIAAKMNG